MKLIDRTELENRLSAELDEETLELVCDIIEDMEYLDCVKTKNGELSGIWWK